MDANIAFGIGKLAPHIHIDIDLHIYSQGLDVNIAFGIGKLAPHIHIDIYLHI